MNRILEFSLKSFRKSISSIKHKERLVMDKIEDPEEASNIIYEDLMSSSPVMISRFGANELSCLINYLDVNRNEKNIFKYVNSEIRQWWWNKSIISNMHTNAGFFPPTIENIETFCKMMLEDIKEIDILGSWLPNEFVLSKELEQVKRVKLHLLDPYWSKLPWTRALENKNVLVIHPFKESIEYQFNRRTLLFDDQQILPKFNLSTLRAVQSVAGNNCSFDNWFDALNYMKFEIEKRDFDICLIGAGAYGLPLAAHVKRLGKNAIHFGGSLQLLFGIRGKRWETKYGSDFDYGGLINDNWIRPSLDEIPKNANNIENGCYW